MLIWPLTEAQVWATLILYSTPLGPMPSRAREALLLVAGDIDAEPEQTARLQRDIARLAS